MNKSKSCRVSNWGSSQSAPPCDNRTSPALAGHWSRKFLSRILPWSTKSLAQWRQEEGNGRIALMATPDELHMLSPPASTLRVTAEKNKALPCEGLVGPEQEADVSYFTWLILKSHHWANRRACSWLCQRYHQHMRGYCGGVCQSWHQMNSRQPFRGSYSRG